MKHIKEFLTKEFPMFYEFKIFVADDDGNRKSVGAAILKEGQDMYHLKIWSLLQEKFFLIPNRKDPKKFFIMTREPLKNQNERRKFNWNIVGNGKATDQDLIELNFDLFEKKIFLNIIPVTFAPTATLPAA